MKYVQLTKDINTIVKEAGLTQKTPIDVLDFKVDSGGCWNIDEHIGTKSPFLAWLNKALDSPLAKVGAQVAKLLIAL